MSRRGGSSGGAASGGGTGDVVGPGSATDNAVVRYDGTTGKLVQDSGVTIDDSGNIVLGALKTVDGRDVSVDGTKLDGIASGAAAVTSSAPADVTKAAASAGASSSAARADHKHDISTAAAGAAAIGDAAAEGTATSLARSDHKHSFAAPAAPADVTKAAASAGAATTFARADHKHDISTAAVSTIGTANSEGTATSLARSDHVHNHGNQTGTSLHAVATDSLLGGTIAHGFMSGADKDCTYAQSKTSILICDFEAAFTAGAPFATVVSGTGAANSPIASVAGHNGIIRAQTGTTTTGRAGVQTNVNTGYLVGDGAIMLTTVIRVPTLSTAAEEFDSYFGYADSVSAPVGTNAILLAYRRATDGVNFWSYTVNGGAVTKNDTTIALNANQWYRLDVVINAAGTSVTFYIDGTLRATHSTNIPSAQALAMIVEILKSAGTTSRTMDIDLVGARIDLTTGR